ncbi:MAG: rubrerythrin family protein [Halobellus sp.]|uniref:rubrerythrin family protein n=1 Tax=Halobellus sp. TaxID=1979212 RepID=UPI0035D4EB73
MDAETLRTRLEADESTALARLGSQQFLRALAGGDPRPEPLLNAAAESEHAARETFTQWVDDESNSEARAVFESVVEQEDDHRERVSDELDEWDPDDGGPGPMHAYLRARESTFQRIAGGLVGRPLVTLQTHARLIDFFDVRQGPVAARRANLFEDLRGETAAVLDEGLALLEEQCASDADWERARMVAGYVIRVAGDDAADAFSAQGIDPASIDE